MRRMPQGQGDYELFPEGVDNDLDGRYNEDGIGGLDLHRNYPENWRPMREATGRGYAQGGAGEYPLSEPETRAVFLFLMTHPNVGLAQSLDTAVPMILRGPSTASTEDGMYPEDAALALKFDKKGMEITGYPWAGDTYHVYATRAGGNPTTGEPPRDSPIFGHGPDVGYHVGLTTAGTIGAAYAMTLAEAIEKVMAIADAGRSARKDIIVICHGGPFDEPENVGSALTQMPGINGFSGASSIERLPTERAIRGQVAEFKGLKLA